MGPRYARVNTDLDHISAVVFTADAHNILYALAGAKTLHVLKRTKVRGVLIDASFVRLSKLTRPLSRPGGGAATR